MFILDTDHIGILQGPRSEAYDNVLKRIAVANDSNVYTTIISFHEIVAGWTKFVKQSNDPH